MFSGNRKRILAEKDHNVLGGCLSGFIYIASRKPSQSFIDNFFLFCINFSEFKNRVQDNQNKQNQNEVISEVGKQIL